MRENVRNVSERRSGLLYRHREIGEGMAKVKGPNFEGLRDELSSFDVNEKCGTKGLKGNFKMTSLVQEQTDTEITDNNETPTEDEGSGIVTNIDNLE